MDVEKLSSDLVPCVPLLCDWFEAGKRLLPWRIQPSPYRVWVSEIMLQQTRIEAVLPYFERFMSELPTVESLASVSPDRLMKLWEGLGYYSRARNLQAAAKELVASHGGELPADFDKLKSLPGIGDYTAGAIASIAFGLPAPAVDGNVLRVLARLTGSRDDVMKPAVRRELTALAARLVPAERPGAFNQALMELGERVCLPNTMPRCDVCPVRSVCAVAGREEAAQLPVRSKKKPRRIENRTVLVLLTNDKTPRVLLHRRDKSGLLAGLWELPNIESHDAPSEPPLGLSRVSDWLALPDSRHIFTHLEWHMKARLCVVEPAPLPPSYEFVTAAALLNDRALPTAFRAYSSQLPTWLAAQY